MKNIFTDKKTFRSTKWRIHRLGKKVWKSVSQASWGNEKSYNRSACTYIPPILVVKILHEENFDRHMTQTCHNYPRQELFQRSRVGCVPGRGGGGGDSKKNWVRGVRPASQNLPYLWPKSAIFPTLFMTWTKLWNLNYDPTLTSKSCFRPAL